MCHLLKDASLDDQIAAYQLIGRAVALRNERLVVEAAMDTEDAFRCEIPSKLLEALPLDISVNANDNEIEEVRDMRRLQATTFDIICLHIPLLSEDTGVPALVASFIRHVR